MSAAEQLKTRRYTVVTSEIKNGVRKRLLEGYRYAEIQEEFGISAKTITRIKKQTPASVLVAEKEDAGDDSIQVDYSTNLTKMEESFRKKLQDAYYLYDDVEEGWVFKLEEGDYRFKTSGMWWAGIAYPESAPENWQERLELHGFRIKVSDLHDRDRWGHDSPAVVNPETGEIIPKGARYTAFDYKKPHWHFIAICEKSISYREANAIIRSCTHGPYIQKCRSLKLMVEYFYHKNHPGKYQHYDKNGSYTTPGFHLEPNKYEVGVISGEIINDIIENQIDNWVDLMEKYRRDPEMMVIITAKPGAISATINAMWRKKHPKGNIQRMLLVDNDEEE